MAYEFNLNNLDINGYYWVTNTQGVYFCSAIIREYLCVFCFVVNSNVSHTFYPSLAVL